MSDDDKALLRLNTMSDWIEFPGFKSSKLLEELKKLIRIIMVIYFEI